MQKPKTDQYFMNYLAEVAEKSHCVRAKVGAVIVRDGEVLVVGCNDIPHDEYD